MYKLRPHPEYGPKLARSVDVELRITGALWMLSYAVQPAGSLVLPDHGVGRRDNLWRGTCFELFIKSRRNSGYREFNFAPLGAWAAYDFVDWRKHRSDATLGTPPHLVDARLDERRGQFPGRYELDVVLPLDFSVDGFNRMSLTTVLEEEDGTLSYWALAHPSGKPNFHHPACFIVDLPPPTAT